MGFFDSFWVYIYMYISKAFHFWGNQIWLNLAPNLFAYRSHMLTCRVNPMCLLLWCGKRLRQFASSPFHQRLSNHPSGIVLKTLADDEANDCRWLDESWWVNQSIIQFFCHPNQDSIWFYDLSSKLSQKNTSNLLRTSPIPPWCPMSPHHAWYLPQRHFHKSRMG